MKELDIQPHHEAMNAEMQSIDARRTSYRVNNRDDAMPVNVEKLVEAGFYYVGNISFHY